MKRMLLAALLFGAGLLGALAPPAQAEPIPVADESAAICVSLNLALQLPDYGTHVQIGVLQNKYDASRAEAVAAMRQAALEYCPEYLAAVPAR